MFKIENNRVEVINLLLGSCLNAIFQKHVKKDNVSENEFFLNVSDSYKFDILMIYIQMQYSPQCSKLKTIE